MSLRTYIQFSLAQNTNITEKDELNYWGQFISYLKKAKNTDKGEADKSVGIHKEEAESDKGNGLFTIEEWFKKNDYHPIEIDEKLFNLYTDFLKNKKDDNAENKINPPTKEEIRKKIKDFVEEQAKSLNLNYLEKEQYTNACFQVYEILLSIPDHYPDYERSAAIQNIKFIIRFNDYHGTTVWGLVSIDLPDITVRWKHSMSRYLERAAEDIVRKICVSSGDNEIFNQFPSDYKIIVRDERHVTNSYEGKVTCAANLNNKFYKNKAKKDKRIEVKIFNIIIVSFLMVLAADISIYFYFGVTPNSSSYWFYNFIGKLEGAFFITAFINWLSYKLYINQLKSRPIIEWE
jgi:hypothetical protein